MSKLKHPASAIAAEAAAAPRGWTWPSPGPGAGMPAMTGPPASVGPPISTGALYLWVIAYWLVVAALAAFVIVRILLLLGLLFGFLSGQHPSVPDLAL